jgi:hypothetical protein
MKLMQAETPEPPFLLDGARVLCHAILGEQAMRRGFSFVAGGVGIDAKSVSRLVVTQSLLDGAVFLLHCNERWETVAAAGAADVETAKAAAAAAYEGIDIPWTPFRELTAEERREMETTARFLRELAAGMLDE